MEKRKYLIMLFLCVTTFFKIVNAHTVTNINAYNGGDGTIVTLDDDLKVDHPVNEITSIIVLDKYGTEIITFEGCHSNKCEQDISSLESGIYIIVAITQGEIFSKQVYKN